MKGGKRRNRKRSGKEKEKIRLVERRMVKET